MEQNRDFNKQEFSGPVLGFISGEINTLAARRLTKGINSIRSLWLLAKMAENVRNQRNL